MKDANSHSSIFTTPKRIGKFLLGVICVLLILGSYGDGKSSPKPFLAFISDNWIIQIILFILLIVLASKLIGGKSRDYSKFFYKLLVKIFGDPKKTNS